MKSMLSAGVLVGLLVGCGGSDWKQQVESKVVKQAAFDLECDAKKIRIQQLDSGFEDSGHKVG